MTDSVELLLDPSGEHAVLEDWRALEDLDLPNQSRHASSSNSPHLTLLAAARIDAGHDAGLASAVQGLPYALATAGLLVFPTKHKYVLARQVVPSPEMIRLHQRIWSVHAAADPAPNTAPGRWTPHITLARGLSAEQLGQAVAAVARRELPPLSAVAARRWDGGAKVVVPLAP
ncbi:2'-5' RNA ligase family protein [Arthrobacter sp. H41]|uniref:2'-5' RNA ligase family protein n=1 Tax=Arthrobacter sp. H41 TaxID=1312978 RepID=UPI0004B89598|nr:2'-5' RNA ligase family protein [Arthrobacter sp. H41]